MKSMDVLAIILAILGAVISGYLLYTRVTGSQIVCGLSDCGTVNNSPYAFFIGIPVTVWGLPFYLAMAILVWAKRYVLYFLFSIGGLAFSTYLTFLEAFVIKAWCQWCILCAWISLSLFIIGLRFIKNNQKANE